MKRIAVALLSLWALPAAGQERPGLTFDPDRIEWALPWAQSSLCLGDASDAFCLAATVVVCGVVRERRECLPRGTYQPHHNPLGGNRIEYRIVRAGYVPRHRLSYLEDAVILLPDVLRLRERREPPTVAQIVIRQRICDPRQPPCATDRETDIVVHLERLDRRWLYLNSSLFRLDDWMSE
jgi:hypothetical protein